MRRRQRPCEERLSRFALFLRLLPRERATRERERKTRIDLRFVVRIKGLVSLVSDLVTMESVLKATGHVRII